MRINRRMGDQIKERRLLKGAVLGMGMRNGF
jgi:hypothetical protein